MKKKKKASLESDILNKKIAEGLTLSGKVHVSANNGMITSSTGAGPAMGLLLVLWWLVRECHWKRSLCKRCCKHFSASGEDAVKSNPVYKAVMQVRRSALLICPYELTKGFK